MDLEIEMNELFRSMVEGSTKEDLVYLLCMALDKDTGIMRIGLESDIMFPKKFKVVLEEAPNAKFWTLMVEKVD